MTSTNTILNYLTPFQLYSYTDGAEDKVLEGYRAAIIRGREPGEAAKAKGVKKLPTMIVALPRITLTVTPLVLQASMTDALAKMQDAAVRSHIDSLLVKEPGIMLAGQMVPQEIGNAEGLASFNATNGVSGRLTKEKLATWYKDTLMEALMDRLIEVAPETSSEVLALKVQKTGEYICKLAAPKLDIRPEFAKQLLKVVILAPSEDAIRIALVKKLDIVINPPSEAEFSLDI